MSARGEKTERTSRIGPSETGLRTAHDVKEVHRSLADDFTDDELKQIPLVPEGQPLQQGAVYVDLKDSRHREFTAIGDMSASPGNWYTPKADVPYTLWNRLVAAANAVRTEEKKRAG